MLQHATDLEGFAPQTSDQGSPLKIKRVAFATLFRFILFPIIL